MSFISKLNFLAQIEGERLDVKGKLESDDSRTCLTANINGHIFKSWLVDQEGTIHLFTKVIFVYIESL